MRAGPALYILLLLLAACAGDRLPDDPPRPTGAPVPERITGIYRLESVDGQPLPLRTSHWDACEEHLTSAAVSLSADRRYVLSGTVRQQCADAEAIESRGGGVRGVYDIEDDAIRFDGDPDRMEGAAEPGWVEDPPDRDLAVRDLRGPGRIEDGTLTIRLDRGGVAIFRKARG